VLDEFLPEASILFGHQSAQPSDLEAFEALLESSTTIGEQEECRDTAVQAQRQQQAIGKAVKRLLLLIHPDKNSHPKAADAVRRVQLLRDEFSFAKITQKENGSSVGSTSTGAGSTAPDASSAKRPAPQAQTDTAPAPKRNMGKGKGQPAGTGKGSISKRPNDAKAKGKQLDSLLSTLRSSKANTCKLQCDLSVEGVQSPTSPLSEKMDSVVFSPSTSQNQPGLPTWTVGSPPHPEQIQSQGDGVVDDEATVPLSPSLVSSFSVRPRGIGTVAPTGSKATVQRAEGSNLPSSSFKLSEAGHLDTLQQAIHDAVEVKLGSGIPTENRQQILTATDISLSSSASLSLGSTLSYSRQTSSLVFLVGEGSVSCGSCSIKGSSLSTPQKESFLPPLPTQTHQRTVQVPPTAQLEPDPRRMPSWIPRKDFDDCKSDPKLLLGARSDGEKESVKVRVQVNVCPLGTKPLPKGKR
jgi:hypothetical protein